MQSIHLFTMPTCLWKIPSSLSCSPNSSSKSSYTLGCSKGIQTTKMLIVSMLIVMSFISRASLADARPGHKKPPFNGSIFGKRSLPANGGASMALGGPLQAMLMQASNGQWASPQLAADTSASGGYDLVAAIQQQDSIIRATINRCLTHQYDSTDQETTALCEDIVALRDQFAASHSNQSPASLDGFGSAESNVVRGIGLYRASRRR